ncbi:MAG: LysE family translocator [bacterium]|nr:LysE family translocator [bacterium]
MLGFLITGITLGAAAGLSPGPLLAFLVSQTLRYGMREGLKVAMAPVLTDLPIVAASLLLLSQLADTGPVLAAIAVIGGLYIAWLGLESIRIRAIEASDTGASPHSVRKAMLINFLNPHVYVFWMTVGSPLVLDASKTSMARAVAFVTGFYVLLCGSKMVLAVLIHRSRGLLAGSAYLWTIRILGIALLVFAVWLLMGAYSQISR